MKYQLETVKYFYHDKEEMENLEKLGFTFEETEHLSTEIDIENSAYLKFRDYSICGEPTIELRSLEELAEFIREYGQIVMDEGTIEIYDDYRE